jgi:hypothetical protein
LSAVKDFLVDLIIGDDPKIAVAVVVALMLAGLALAAGASAGLVTVGGAVIVVLCFTVTLFVDVRR